MNNPLIPSSNGWLITTSKRDWDIKGKRCLIYSQSEVEIGLTTENVSDFEVSDYVEACRDEIQSILQTDIEWDRDLIDKWLGFAGYRVRYQALVCLDSTRHSQLWIEHGMTMQLIGKSMFGYCDDGSERRPWQLRHSPLNSLWIFAPSIANQISKNLPTIDELEIGQTRKRSARLYFRNAHYLHFKDMETEFLWSPKAQDCLRTRTFITKKKPRNNDGESYGRVIET